MGVGSHMGKLGASKGVVALFRAKGLRFIAEFGGRALMGGW